MIAFHLSSSESTHRYTKATLSLFNVCISFLENGISFRQGLHHVAQISKYIIFPLWSSRILVMSSFAGVFFVNFNNVFSLCCAFSKCSFVSTYLLIRGSLKKGCFTISLNNEW